MSLLNSIKTRFHDMRQRSRDQAEFKAKLLAAVADGSISDSEMAALQSNYRELGLTLDDLAKIRVEAYAIALRAAKSDGTVSAEEAAELDRIQSFLKIPDSEIRTSKLELQRLRVVAEIQAGQLPQISVANIVLQRSEIAHWSEPAALLEERVVARRYEGGSTGVSVRIAKGLSWRVGQNRGHLVTDKAVLEVSHGDFVVTSKRVIFRGDLKSFNYRHDKLLELQMYSDGARVTGTTGSPRIVKFASAANGEVVAAVLSAAISRFNSPDA